MIHLNRRTLLLGTAAVAVTAATPLFAASPKPLSTGPTALDLYVAKKDDVYGWTMVNEVALPIIVAAGVLLAAVTLVRRPSVGAPPALS